MKVRASVKKISTSYAPVRRKGVLSIPTDRSGRRLLSALPVRAPKRGDKTK